jgi:hypothetical protein
MLPDSPDVEHAADADSNEAFTSKTLPPPQEHLRQEGTAGRK